MTGRDMLGLSCFPGDNREVTGGEEGAGGGREERNEEEWKDCKMETDPKLGLTK